MLMSGISDFMAPLVELSAACLFLVLFAVTVRTCIADARRRGKSPLLVTLAVIFFFPLGLIAWLLFRPDPLDGGKGNPFRLNDHRVQ
jgi:uncharacterized membrane protein YadS